ncbi:ogr/Delta-like zinc finger family protein [Burkholderia ubonensis]|uniref:ogr/Delta-like zinc finger family protein n=1 Tax=Burkholderia ubonensis TaxID=101571 RepID=UPI0009B38E60
MSVSIACPVCQSRAVARSIRKLSDTLREIRYRCENDERGHVYIAHLEAVRTVVPSATIIQPVHGRTGLSRTALKIAKKTLCHGVEDEKSTRHFRRSYGILRD